MKKSNLLNKDPLMEMMKSSLLSLPTPASISFLWNMGFLLGMTLMLQIITGLVLSMNYISCTELAFDSVMHIMRDLESGWLMRYLHMNGASLFFLLMYIHMARGIYFNSTKNVPMVWTSGVLIVLSSMGAAFMGYVLPWGQMSFWGVTVITSMLTAIPYIGKDLTQWIWGNFSVSQPTLNRFLSFHFLIPFLIVFLVVVHLMLLHKTGSSNPLGINSDMDKMKFFPRFAIKDMVPLLLIFILMSVLISLSPNMLGDVENFTMASAATTPTHILPEWYFLFAYAILRAIPSKLGGVIAMISSILIMLILTIKKESLNKKFEPVKKITFWLFTTIAMVLTWIGASPVEHPFVLVGQIFTMLYFLTIMNL